MKPSSSSDETALLSIAGIQPSSETQPSPNETPGDSSNTQLVIYVATQGGLSISTDGGTSFVNRVVTNVSSTTDARDVYMDSGIVYVATKGGIGISCDMGVTFTTKTTADGLGHDFVDRIFAEGPKIYVSTGANFHGGLSISSDWGQTFNNKTTTSGLPTLNVRGVYASGSTVYAAVGERGGCCPAPGGFSISTNGGASFSTTTMANGLGAQSTFDLVVTPSKIYASDTDGISISTDGGSTFTASNFISGNFVAMKSIVVQNGTIYVSGDKPLGGGLWASSDGGVSYSELSANTGYGLPPTSDVFVFENTIYATTTNGLNISTDNGQSFTTKTTADGLGSNNAFAVFVARVSEPFTEPLTCIN